MTSLFITELRRLTSRRLFKALTILALLGFVVAGTILFFQSDDSPEAIADVQAERQAAVSNCISDMESIEAAGGEGLPAEARSDPEGFCRRQMTAPASDPRFRYEDLTPVLRGLGVPLMMLGWLVGASSMGAEWHNRTITSLLTWEPRRVRALVAKMVAAVVIVSVWVALLLVAFLLAVYPCRSPSGHARGRGCIVVGRGRGNPRSHRATRGARRGVGPVDRHGGAQHRRRAGRRIRIPGGRREPDQGIQATVGRLVGWGQHRSVPRGQRGGEPTGALMDCRRASTPRL
jgi:hypothetical protein